MSDTETQQPDADFTRTLRNIQRMVADLSPAVASSLSIEELEHELTYLNVIATDIHWRTREIGEAILNLALRPGADEQLRAKDVEIGRLERECEGLKEEVATYRKALHSACAKVNEFSDIARGVASDCSDASDTAADLQEELDQIGEDIEEALKD